MSATSTTGFTAQFRDWSGEWLTHGRVSATAREARDLCIASLASLGYSGCDVRVLRLTTSRICEVVEVPA